MTLDHASDETLSALLDQQLPAAELRIAEDHVAACAECATRLAGLRSVAAMLRSLPHVEPPRDFALGPRLVADPPNLIRLQRWYVWTRAGAASLAAAFVFLVAGTVYLDSAPRARSTTTSFEAPAALESKAAPAAAPAPTAAPAANAQSAPPAPAAAPQVAARQAAAPASKPEAASGAVAASDQSDQVAAATSVRALPTPAPTVAPAAPPAAPAPVAAAVPASTTDPAAPVRTAAAIAGVLAVLALLAAFIARHRLARSRAAITTLE